MHAPFGASAAKARPTVVLPTPAGPLIRTTWASLTPAAPPPLYRRLDVLIEAEQVGRVVGVLERDQPFVARPVVRRTHAVLPLGAELVHVDADRVGLHRRPEVARPRDVSLRLLGVVPERVD